MGEGRITWTWKAEVAVSQDCTTALQPGWETETMSPRQKKEKKRKEEEEEEKEHIHLKPD